LELLSNGWSIDDILREYPHLSREDVLAAIKYAARVWGRKLLSKPRLLAGESIPRTITATLRGKGYDVVSVLNTREWADKPFSIYVGWLRSKGLL